LRERGIDRGLIVRLLTLEHGAQHGAHVPSIGLHGVLGHLDGILLGKHGAGTSNSVPNTTTVRIIIGRIPLLLTAPARFREWRRL